MECKGEMVATWVKRQQDVGDVGDGEERGGSNGEMREQDRATEGRGMKRIATVVSGRVTEVAGGDFRCRLRRRADS